MVLVLIGMSKSVFNTAIFGAAFALTLLNLLFSPLARAHTELHNASEIRARLGLDSFLNKDALRNIKIAVLDTGFQGFEANSGVLPRSTELVEKYDWADGNNSLEPTPHGLYMAQIIWALTGNHVDGPQFYLLNTNGLTNLRRATAFAIEHKVDIILYSQNWEYGGNFDGHGFINEIVNEATSHGIIWVNAAGNYGSRVFNGLVARLSDENNCLKFVNKYDRNQISLTLAWNDFQESEDYQTNKDLDLLLVDSRETIIARGDRAQVRLPATVDDRSLPTRRPSAHARERINAVLDRGQYCIRIKNVSKNFAATDTVRVSVMSDNKPEDALEFVDHSPGHEIMIPADNPNVIAVGNLSPQSSRGPTADGRSKPDIVLDLSEARFTDGFISSGTSNSAAYFAGIVAALKSHNTSLSRNDLLELAKKNTHQIRRSGLGLPGTSGTPIIDKLLLWNFERDALLTASNIEGISVDQRLRTLYIDRPPLEAGSLFIESALNYISRGVSPENLRFFIASSHTQDGWSRVDVRVTPNWQTWQTWQTLPHNQQNKDHAPLFLDEQEVNAPWSRWIEVRKTQTTELNWPMPLTP